MWFVIAGVVLLLMKVTEFGPVAGWSWIAVLAPFGLAVLWWTFSDSIGLTQKRAMRKMDERKEERRQRTLKSLGLDSRHDKHARTVQDENRRASRDDKDRKPRS